MNSVFPNASELLSRYSHNFKFEDFQKSEIFYNELEEGDFVFRCYATIQKGRLLIIKEERLRNE